MKINKSVLLNNSSRADVQYTGGNMLIPGLDPMKKTGILDFSQMNYRGEVSQVVTVGGNLYIPTNATTYKVYIGDNQRRVNGQAEPLKPYAFVTPVDVTVYGNAAAQREAINSALVSRINEGSNYNYVVAASLGGGNGFTITDTPNYNPVNSQLTKNRKGASTIRVGQVNGYGFTSAALVTTTKSVLSNGVGANLAKSAPLFDFVTGNLIAGEIDAPKVFGTNAIANVGQRYNMFSIAYLENTVLPTIGESYRGYRVAFQSVYVDNGTGTVVDNLAGYVAFEKEMHRGMAEIFSTDPSSQIDFLDNVILFQGANGLLPTTTGENKMVSDAKWVYNQIGTQTLATPTPGNAGLILDQDLLATEGAEYTPSLLTGSPKQFVVGKQNIYVFARVTATVWANAAWQVSLRTKQAHSATFAYSNLVAIGSLAATPTVVTTQGILASAALVATPTGAAPLVNSISNTVEILVNIAGVVTVKLNDVVYPVYSSYTSPTVNVPLVFAQNTVLVPSMRYVQVTTSAPLLVEQEFLALPTLGFKY